MPGRVEGRGVGAREVDCVELERGDELLERRVDLRRFGYGAACGHEVIDLLGAQVLGQGGGIALVRVSRLALLPPADDEDLLHEKKVIKVLHKIKIYKNL